MKLFGYITTFAAKALTELEGSPFSVQCVVAGKPHDEFQIPIYVAVSSQVKIGTIESHEG